jgi:hypothetical protein
VGFASNSASRDETSSVGIGLSERERSIFSKGDETGEEGNSGGVTASCSLDETESDWSRKQVILAEGRETSGLQEFILF